MHELMVTQSILDITLRYAQEAGAQKVLDVYVVIGQLSSMVDDSIWFHWDILNEGTPAQGATLHFIRIPAELRCLNCDHTFPPNGTDFICPTCQSDLVKVLKGDEFFMESIEVE